MARETETSFVDARYCITTTRSVLFAGPGGFVGRGAAGPLQIPSRLFGLIQINSQITATLYRCKGGYWEKLVFNVCAIMRYINLHLHSRNLRTLPQTS